MSLDGNSTTEVDRGSGDPGSHDSEDLCIMSGDNGHSFPLRMGALETTA